MERMASRLLRGKWPYSAYSPRRKALLRLQPWSQGPRAAQLPLLQSTATKRGKCLFQVVGRTSIIGTGQTSALNLVQTRGEDFRLLLLKLNRPKLFTTSILEASRNEIWHQDESGKSDAFHPGNMLLQSTTMSCQSFKSCFATEHATLPGLQYALLHRCYKAHSTILAERLIAFSGCKKLLQCIWHYSQPEVVYIIKLTYGCALNWSVTKNECANQHRRWRDRWCAIQFERFLNTIDPHDEIYHLGHTVISYQAT